MGTAYGIPDTAVLRAISRLRGLASADLVAAGCYGEDYSRNDEGQAAAVRASLNELESAALVRHPTAGEIVHGYRIGDDPAYLTRMWVLTEAGRGAL